MDESAATLALAIGARVRQQRQSRRWTLDQLAEAAGVSRRMVVNVEQGAANPSVGTLLRISDALGVGLPALVEPPRSKPVKVTRQGDGAVLWSSESGGRGVLVAGTEPPDVAELWDWTLGPGDRHGSEAHTPGTKELIQVQQGTIRVEVAGQPVTLEAGDAVAFPGDVAHSYANPRNEPARFSLAVFEPGVVRDHDRRLTMPDAGMLQEFLAGGQVDAAVFALRPDYRAMLLAVDGIVPGPSDQASDALLQAAESAAAEALRGQPVEQLPHVAAWREAYRAFGAKPKRTRNSLEALLRRAASGLPRVNRLTDLYNAVSVQHQIPLGGEDLTRYTGPPRLVRALGTEPFDTVADGVGLTEHPEPGEVVWCDDAGVTCRRWNWRQARRTQLSDDTTTVLFILDALDPMTDEALHTAADDLVAHLFRLGPGVQAARRLIAAGPAPGEGA